MSLNLYGRGIASLHFEGGYYVATLEYGEIEGGLLPENFTELDCSNNLLSELPELPEGLTILDCRQNILEKLPRLPSSLITLSVGENKLKSLPSLPESLQELLCYSNDIQRIPEIPKNLEVLQCFNNPLYYVIPRRPQEGRRFAHIDMVLSEDENLKYLYSEDHHRRYQDCFWGIRDLMVGSIVKRFVKKMMNKVIHRRKFADTLLAIKYSPNFGKVFFDAEKHFSTLV